LQEGAFAAELRKPNPVANPASRKAEVGQEATDELRKRREGPLLQN